MIPNPDLDTSESTAIHEFSISGIKMASMTESQLIDDLIGSAQSNSSRLFTYANAHCVNVAHQDIRYRSALQEFNIIYPDGMSIVWAGRFLGYRVKERLSAADYFIRFCEEATRKHVSIFLLGGYPDVPGRAAESLMEKVPGLKIAGWRNGFFRNDDEIRDCIGQINESKAQLLIVGMSVPVQEKWVVNHRSELRPPVIWCVGALFEYFSGRTPRCPRWMARFGLEWLFRLAVEPRRMWKRYLIGNVLFVCRVLDDKFKRKKQ